MHDNNVLCQFVCDCIEACTLLKPSIAERQLLSLADIPEDNE
jgi:hypothetical protein